MVLEINFKSHDTVVLILKDGRKIIDLLDLNFDRNLDEVLIGAVDKILEKNKIDILSLKKGAITGKLAKESLSHQVAKSFIKGLNLGNFSEK